MNSNYSSTKKLLAPAALASESFQGWAAKIKQSTREEGRTQPWKTSYGEPVGGVNDEDWINYPAVQDMAKKGIKG